MYKRVIKTDILQTQILFYTPNCVSIPVIEFRQMLLPASQQNAIFCNSSQRAENSAFVDSDTSEASLVVSLEACLNLSA